jgi:Zn-dependent protease
MRCQKCQKEAFLPFKCPYCGGQFCSEHRLPENHECSKIELARIPKREAQTITVQKQRPREYAITYTPLETKKGINFSAKEIKHLTVAALLVMGIGLSLAMSQIAYVEIGGPFMLAVFALIVTASFLMHEIAHKMAAQRRGLWAEFRLIFSGTILTLLSIILPMFKIIAPGAVMIAGFADRKSIGKISIAGPLTNIALSTILLTSVLLNLQHKLLLIYGAAFNAWIALFNLIPFGMLDGFKIFIWNKLIWALAFTASLALTMILYQIIL